MKTKLLLCITTMFTIFTTYAQCTGDVAIPNVAFKSYLLNEANINTDGNNQISCAEAAAFTGGIVVTGLGITNLTGIEAFTNLSSLVCFNNNLTSLDVSANTALTLLNFNLNSITSIDVSNNPNLEVLICFSNALTTIDVSNNPNLQRLVLEANTLTTIDVSNNPNLEVLLFANNSLTSLDISNNTNLAQLSCNNNAITTLDISNNPAMEILNCSNNELRSLKLTNNNSLLLNATTSNFRNNPNLSCIEVDDAAFANSNWAALKDATAVFSEDCSTLSTDDFLENTIAIYPNPVTTSFTIDITNNLKQVTIYSITGNKVLTTTSKTVDITSLPTGIYIAKITTDTNKTAVKRIIKN